jgi:hypothetical protein
MMETPPDVPLIKTRHTAETLARALERHQHWLDRQVSIAIDTSPLERNADLRKPEVSHSAHAPRREYFRMAKAGLRTRRIARLTRVW